LWIWVLAVVFMLPAVAHADLTVREETRMSGMMGMLSSKGTEATYIKGEKMRSETKTEMGGMMGGMMQGGSEGKTSDMVTITRLDKGVIWFVNGDDSTYTEMSLKGPKVDSLGRANMKIKDISVKKTGQTKTIITHKCEGTEVDITFDMAMGEGKEREIQTHNVKTLFWMRPEVKDLEELRRFWDQMVDVARVSQEGSPMASAMGPVFGKLKEIQGVPLGMEMTMANPMGGGAVGEDEKAEMREAMKMVHEMTKGKGEPPGGEVDTESDDIRMTRFVTSVSKGSLNDSLFEVPKGYTKTETLEGMFQSAPTRGPGK
jgi:hypothetical protein